VLFRSPPRVSLEMIERWEDGVDVVYAQRRTRKDTVFKRVTAWGFYWALDNRMYTAGMADIHLRLKDMRFEVQRTLQRGEWGVAQDDAGRIYRNTNESALHVDLVPTAYYARNPNLLRTRGSYERLADGNPDLNIVWPVRPNPGTNRAYQAGRLILWTARYTSARPVQSAWLPPASVPSRTRLREPMEAVFPGFHTP
jgi:hypothetical protein